MAQLKAYHRPSSIEEALQLLARPQVNAAVVAGGTNLNARLNDSIEEVVDLQGVGLDEVIRNGDRLTFGAMVRVQTLAENGQVPALVRDLAHREGPNTFRNQGAVGGLVAGADPESELLAALLVFEAEVEIQSTGGARRLALADFLADVPAALNRGLITSVSFAATGQGAAERAARTPADSPIVAAVGRLDEQGQVRLSLCGVAQTPILVSSNADQLKSQLNPPGNFRGSSEYRRQIAVVLARRVVAELKGE
jgi:probable selenate reductase FAD-binding subunit